MIYNKNKKGELMINSLNEKIKNKRLSLNLKQIDIQNLSYDYFGENEVINIDYIQIAKSRLAPESRTPNPIVLAAFWICCGCHWF